ncbi:hypothetical protein JCM3770_001601 [Rhodotorula araucariae]
MFAGLNLKSLQDRVANSLHDLEHTLAASSPSPSGSPARPGPGQRAATEPSPSTPRTTSAPAPLARPSLEGLAGRAASLVGPLSPTAAAAQQSASQLADSALSSLRASLRKGRASLEGVAAAAAPAASRPSGDAARLSLDGQARGSPRRRQPGGALRREGSNDSFREEDEMRKLRELASPPPAPVTEEPLVSFANDAPPEKLEEEDFFAPSPPTPTTANFADQLVDFSEDPAPAPPLPRSLSPTATPFLPAVSAAKKSSLAPPTPQPDSAGEDDDAWGVGDVEEAPPTPVVPSPPPEGEEGADHEPVVLNEPAATPIDPSPAVEAGNEVERGEAIGTISAAAGGEDILPLAEEAVPVEALVESAGTAAASDESAPPSEPGTKKEQTGDATAPAAAHTGAPDNIEHTTEQVDDPSVRAGSPERPAATAEEEEDTGETPSLPVAAVSASLAQDGAVADDGSLVGEESAPVVAPNDDHEAAESTPASPPAKPAPALPAAVDSPAPAPAPARDPATSSSDPLLEADKLATLSNVLPLSALALGPEAGAGPADPLEEADKLAASARDVPLSVPVPPAVGSAADAPEDARDVVAEPELVGEKEDLKEAPLPQTETNANEAELAPPAEPGQAGAAAPTEDVERSADELGAAPFALAATPDADGAGSPAPVAAPAAAEAEEPRPESSVAEDPPAASPPAAEDALALPPTAEDAPAASPSPASEQVATPPLAAEDAPALPPVAEDAPVASPPVATEDAPASPVERAPASPDLQEGRATPPLEANAPELAPALQTEKELPAVAFDLSAGAAAFVSGDDAVEGPVGAVMPGEVDEAADEVDQRAPPSSAAVALVPATSLDGSALPAATKSTLDRLVATYLAPLDSVDDLDAFEGALQNLKGKEAMATAEVKRLSSQLERGKEAVEELRETHRLEHKSQQDEIDLLRAQLADKDARLAAAEAAAVQTRAEIGNAAEEYDKLKIVAKEEEEKRIKALSLLRALRQKLVKNEQDKGESDRLLAEARAGERQAQDTLKADRARFDSEIVALRAAQEQQVNKLKQSFERETANLRAQYERDATNKKGQFELDAITAKAQQAKELAARETRIQQLEATVRELSAARDGVFEQLQLRQAEAESSAAAQEALRTRAAELEYDAAEARDRAAALQDEVDELRRHRHDAAREEGTTRRLLEEAEARHAAKVRDLEARARQLEKDRRELEDEMGRNLQDRLREVERLRAALAKKDVDFADSVQNSQKREKEIEEAQKARAEVEKRLKAVEASHEALREEAERAQQAEAAAKEELSDRLQRATELEARLEEVQTRESNLRSTNKTLREELRKLQSGVLLSEKQRQPGVGYFASFSQQSTPVLSGAAGSSTTSLAPSPPLASTPTDASAPTLAVANPNGNADEAISYEYLRNVVLQFLERPEMRPHLVQVLGVILQFTPAELRRLAAKSAAQ